MNLLHPRRRNFLQLALSSIGTAIFAGLPKIGLPETRNDIYSPETRSDDKGFIVREEEGIHLLTGRRKMPINIKLSKEKHGLSDVSFCVEHIAPGRKMRIHKHLNNDEIIFIHKGQGTVTLDETTHEVNTGDLVYVPRGVWHGLDNTGQEEIKMVFQYTPAGFEQYFIENGTLEGKAAKERTPEEYAATEKKYGMLYKDNVLN